MAEPDNWLRWREIPWRDLPAGPKLDLLVALWCYEWTIIERHVPTLIAADGTHHPFERGDHANPSCAAPAYSSRIDSGWRVFAKAALMTPEEKGAVLIHPGARSLADPSPYDRWDDVPVRLQVDGGSTWEGTLPWAACMAAIEIAEAVWKGGRNR